MTTKLFDNPIDISVNDLMLDCKNIRFGHMGTSLTEEHVIHNDCTDDVVIEHYGLEFWDHNWPDEVGGEPTYELMWDFLSEFSKDSSDYS